MSDHPHHGWTALEFRPRIFRFKHLAVDLGLWQLIVRGVVQLPSQIVEERLEPRIEELFGLIQRLFVMSLQIFGNDKHLICCG